MIVFLPYVLACPCQANNSSGNKNTTISLASVTAVAIVKTSIWTNRNRGFKRPTKSLRKCVLQKVLSTYVPPELNEFNHQTESRRRKLKDLCDPKEAVERRKRDKKNAERKRTPENKQKPRRKCKSWKTKRKLQSECKIQKTKRKLQSEYKSQKTKRKLRIECKSLKTKRKMRSESKKNEKNCIENTRSKKKKEKNANGKHKKYTDNLSNKIRSLSVRMKLTRK